MSAIDHASVCTFDCPDTCSLSVTVEDGRITKVRGSEATPFTAGVICNKVARDMPAFVHGPQRLLHPLRRTGAKGAGSFERISWPAALAPFAVHLVAIGGADTPEHNAAERLYETLRDGGFEVLYDDRDAGPGEKFADAELLGCPLRLTVGRRSLASGEIEAQMRRGLLTTTVPVEGAATAVAESWRRLA